MAGDDGGLPRLPMDVDLSGSWRYPDPGARRWIAGQGGLRQMDLSGTGRMGRCVVVGIMVVVWRPL